MQRHVAHEARYIHVVWHPRFNAYEFRLMYGKHYLTPRFRVTPLDWYHLIMHKGLEINWKPGEGERAEAWLVLQLKGNALIIHLKKALGYPLPGGVPQEWPQISWNVLYDEMARERGELPEKGWQAGNEAYLDSIRASWHEKGGS